MIDLALERVGLSLCDRYRCALLPPDVILPEEMYYSAGGCSVCGLAGDALFVKNAQTGRIIFFCPSCGIAWNEPPKVNYVETIDPVESLSPAGILMPSRDEICAAGLDHLIQRQVEERDWKSLVTHWFPKSGG